MEFGIWMSSFQNQLGKTPNENPGINITCTLLGNKFLFSLSLNGPHYTEYCSG